MLRTSCAVAVLCLITSGCKRRDQRPPASVPIKEAPVPAEQQQNQPAPVQRLTGTLRGGVIAIGAETTGWVLETDDAGRVDVDVSKVMDAAQELDGKRVVIEGAMVTATWVERGAKHLLMADSVSAADSAK